MDDQWTAGLDQTVAALGAPIMRRPRLLLPALVVAAGVVLSGCSNDPGSAESAREKYSKGAKDPAETDERAPEKTDK